MIKRTSRTLLLLALSLILFGCGQKGPLYLPEPPPVNEQQPENVEMMEEINKVTHG